MTVDQVDTVDVVGTEPRGRRARRNERQATIVDLYQRHHAELVRFATLVTTEPSVAEDLVQDAFVQLYKRLDRLEQPDRVDAYLRSTVVNLARSRWRRLAVRRRHQPEPSPFAEGADAPVLRSADRDRVLAALATLPRRQRECLVLRHYDDRTESEIADILDISVGSVRTHVHRGTLALAARLQDAR